MKLRNKKTGEIYTLSEDLYIEYTQGGKIEVRAIIPGGNMSFYYESLTKLNDDWEDYDHKEPLIKDEKARKAIRAWADMQRSCWIIKETDQCCRDSLGYFFNSSKEIFGDLELGIEYTITELCGEEE